MKNNIKFKILIILYAITLLLNFNLFKYKYFLFNDDNTIVVRVNRITGQVRLIKGHFE